MTDQNSYFHRLMRGEIQTPAVLTLLGSRIQEVDAQAGILRARYEAKADFLNPAGTVQGGMLSAMLDDLTASLVDATLQAGQGVVTLNLNVSFLRPVAVGEVQGQARLVRRGREVCHVTGSLWQQGQEVALATATCKIVSLELAPSRQVTQGGDESAALHRRS